MARRGSAKPRMVEKDPIYGSGVISKLINRAMKDGKKSVAQKEVYRAMELIAKESSKDALAVFNTAMEAIKPTMEVRPRRIGGAAYQVPMTVRGPRRESLAIRWLVNAARSRSNTDFHTFAQKLAAELLDAVKGEGGAMKKKADMERMAEANRAFSHFRW